MNPKELLQIIHNRGEQAHVPAAAHDQARAAAQELAKWIDAQLAETAKRDAESKPKIPVAPKS